MKNSRKAFTLIELIIVLAMSALFSTLAITYSSTGRNEVALSVEADKISQFILQAKQLSIATFGPSADCGYGVALNLAASPQTYSIFAYTPAGSPPCPKATSITGISASDMSKYTDGTWNVPVSQGVTILQPQQNNSLQVVLFYPPDPTVFLSTDGSTFPNLTSYVYLQAAGGGSNITISVNPEGQVSF